MRFAVFLLAIAALAAASGCSDACDDAADKLEECGIIPATVEDEDDDNELECDAAVECSAECVNDATCEELQRPEDASSSFAACVRSCEEG